MQKPFESALALVDFFERDEPEHYVFRGQVRDYGGPMLPSGIRQRFTPFDGSSGPSEWAGVTTSLSVLEDDQTMLRQGVTSSVTALSDGESAWNMPEEAYQEGFREFYNQPNHQRMEVLGKFLRESAIPALSTLLGDVMGNVLCQQYGFTSLALDVSTDPNVALFFATHQAPFYAAVDDASQIGVIYRWPKKNAVVARDLLLPLEDAACKSIASSLRDFVHNSASLTILQEELLKLAPPKRMMVIRADDAHGIGALRVPLGAFDRSRMGRQGAAILRPLHRIVAPLRPRRKGDRAALIGDLLKTHGGEAFHFRHGRTSLTRRLTKFGLWPSIRPTDSLAALLALGLRHRRFVFEDPYLEMMLRFFSSCSPCAFVIWPHGVTNGVVDLGYLLHPPDAAVMVERLRTPDLYTPTPTLRHIPEEFTEVFRAAIAAATAA